MLFRSLIGSRAYGFARPDSDWDWRGAYLAPLDQVLGLGEIPKEKQLAAPEGQEVILWEAKKFLNLALKANPSVLEVLWSPAVVIPPEYQELVTELFDNRYKFLSLRICDTFYGYAREQLLKAKRKGPPSDQKHLAHCARLMIVGNKLLTTGEMVSQLTGTPLEIVTAILWGKTTPNEAIEYIEESMGNWNYLAKGSTQLPRQPDVAWVNDWLVRLRKTYS